MDTISAFRIGDIGLGSQAELSPEAKPASS